MMLNERARNKNKVRKQAKLLYATGVRGAVSGWKGVSSECGRRGFHQRGPWANTQERTLFCQHSNPP